MPEFKTVRALLADPKRWCKRVYKDHLTGQCCLRYAVLDVYGLDRSRELVVVDAINQKSGHASLEAFNDSCFTTHADILRVLDLAAKELGVDEI